MDGKKFSIKDYFLLANLILALIIWLGDCLYLQYDKLWMKSVTSALFVIIGVVNFIYLMLFGNKRFKFPALMLTGLTFAMLGDIVLEIEFIAGAALFAIGHVFYFVAYSMLQKIKWTDFIYAVCILVPAVLLITLAPVFDFDGIVMEIVCVVYAAVISCMVGKAVANLVRVKSKKNIVIVLGSLLFMISDLALLFNVFSSMKYAGAICLATYYPAEILLGLSIFLHANEEDPAALKPTASAEQSKDSENDR
ncbi:MAG: lysoplasmalogenase [Clostridia bacterium]|nr:lysoplasmalogenase [Clostridia bacterium]